MQLDLRSLAIFRIALGALILAFVWQLAPDADAFFSSLGSPSSSGAKVWLLLVLPVFSVLLALGVLTRLSTLVCWCGVIALQDANEHIFFAADTLMRLLLFWALFLPLEAMWSVDAWLFGKPSFRLPLTTWLAVWGITLQICFVYWFTALLKSDPLWLQNHNALFYALSLEQLTSPLGLSLRLYRGLLRVLTTASLYFEFIGPALLFIPIWRDRFRLLAVTSFLGFHLIGLQLLLRVGIFPWVCAVAWLIFIPAFFWDRLTGMNSFHQPPRPSSRSASFIDRSVAAFLIISFFDIIIWNISSLRGDAYVQWMRHHDVSRKIVHISQRWNMYAPYPRADHGWLVIPTELVDGSQVDLFTGLPVSWEKPPNLMRYLGDERWRRYLDDLMYNQKQETLRQYAAYLTAHWNQSHPAAQRVKSLSIVYMQQVTQPDLTISQPEKVSLYSHSF